MSADVKEVESLLKEVEGWKKSFFTLNKHQMRIVVEALKELLEVKNV